MEHLHFTGQCVDIN